MLLLAANLVAYDIIEKQNDSLPSGRESFLSNSATLIIQKQTFTYFASVFPVNLLRFVHTRIITPTNNKANAT